METLKKYSETWRARFRFWRLENLTRSKEKDFVTIVSSKIPVVLVAGIYAGGKSLRPMKEFFEEKGWPVDLAPAKKNYESVPVLAKRLEKRILAIPAKKVQIVAHSMGGITTLAALQNPEVFAKVEQVITLGSPLNGCALGNLAFWEIKKNHEFISLDSRKICELTSLPKINRKFRSLRAKFDPVVFPAKASILTGARENYEIDSIGHVSLILMEESWREVAKRLSE